MTLIDAADTSAEARQVQLEALRRVGGATRVAMACEMSDEARQISEAGIRYRHPDWSDERVQYEVRILLLGDELARRVAVGLGTR